MRIELGGNAAQIVFEDADVERAVGSAIKAFVFNTGQFCMGGPRLLVAHPLFDTMTGILGQAVAGVPVGDPFDEATVMGPMAAERHQAKVDEYVRLAREEGGQAITGGQRIHRNGFFYQPTVIAGLPNTSRVVREEIFGPVLTVQPFDTEDEAVDMANSTAYGLAAGLQTRDVARAHRVAARLDAGIVWVNDWAMLDPAMPFGGVKTSGFGREYGPEALDAYTRTPTRSWSASSPQDCATPTSAPPPAPATPSPTPAAWSRSLTTHPWNCWHRSAAASRPAPAPSGTCSSPAPAPPSWSPAPSQCYGPTLTPWPPEVPW